MKIFYTLFFIVGFTTSLFAQIKCNGIFRTEKETYRNGQTRFEYSYCNDTCVRVDNYRKDGVLIGTKKYSYTPDTVSIMNVYREDGSKVIYERQINGRDDGEYYIYYPDGSVQLEAMSKNGIRLSERIYNEKGVLTIETLCDEQGMNCISKAFDEKGNVIKEKKIKASKVVYKPVK